MIKTLLSKLMNSRGHSIAPGWKLSRGQSLVEFGLTLPVLLLIVAGTVEVTNMLTIYNELQLAVREGARFAAQGAPNNTILGVVNQSLDKTAVEYWRTDTPTFVPPAPPTPPDESFELNVWVIRPALDVNAAVTDWVWYDPSGGSKDSWGPAGTQQCITFYTNGTAACDPVNPPLTPRMVGTQLWAGAANASLDLQPFAIVVARYNVQTLLNIGGAGLGGVWNTPNGKIPVYSYVVLRQEVSALTASQLSGGCSAYPLAISTDALPPEPSDTSGPMTLPLNAGPSDVNFDFLVWNYGATGTANTKLANSLTLPGNSQKDIPAGNTSQYYDNPFSDSTQLRRGSWVPASTATSPLGAGAVKTALDNIKTTQRTLRVILYEVDNPVETKDVLVIPTADNRNPGQILAAAPPLPAGALVYQVFDFMIVRITDVTATSVQFKFVKFDGSCGYQQ